MATTITYDEIQNNRLKIEGTIAYISVWNQKIWTLLLIKILLIPSFEKMEKMLDLRIVDKDIAEKLYSSMKNLYKMYQDVLPILLELQLPFYKKKDKEKIIHYYEYLEDVIEALEIGMDKESASKIEYLANETAISDEVPPWREALEQI